MRYRTCSRMARGPRARSAVLMARMLQLDEDAFYVQAPPQVAQRVKALRCGRIQALQRPAIQRNMLMHEPGA